MLGCACSCIPIGALMSKFGRKWTMIALACPCVAGWLLVMWARNLAMLLIGRFLLGLAGGAFHVAAPQYSSEIAEKEIRGTLGSFCIVNMNAGILFSYILGAYVSVFWTSFISGVIPLLFALIFVFMPESPHFLVMKNRENEARKTLKWLRGLSYDPSREINELKHEFEENKKNQATVMEILERPATKRALFIGFSLMFFQQACGINAVIFYSTFIFTVS